MKKRSLASRFGFYFAAIGAAFGLGNLWRFPYVVTENGGGAFVLLYMALVFLVGMPLLIGEMLLGQRSSRSVILAVRHFNQVGAPRIFYKNFGSFASRFSTLICFLVLSYFAVISGWVIHFVFQFVLAGEGVSRASFESLQSSGSLQVFYTVLHLLAVIVVVAQDFEEGIGRTVGYLMTGFAVLLVALIVQTFSLEDTPEALRYFLYPDFSKLGLASMGQALGHVFFTLSVGFGSMVTFGSSFRGETPIPVVGFRIASLDFFISLMAGLLVFPLAFLSAETLRGPELLFVTVPDFFSGSAEGTLFGLSFFLCLYLAALGASIGLFRSVVANVVEVYRLTRKRASWWVGGAALGLSIIPALSSSELSTVQIAGRGILESVDSLLINWLLPLAGLGLCHIIAHRLTAHIPGEAFEDGVSQGRLFGYWVFILKYVVPAVIVLSLGLQVVALLEWQ